MFIPDPDFYPSRIPDPKTAIKGIGEKKLVGHTFFWSHKLNYFILDMLKKKNWANFQRITENRKKPIPDPGSRVQKDTGSRIRITALCHFNDVYLT
jgi:hypothetical protein